MDYRVAIFINRNLIKTITFFSQHVSFMVPSVISVVFTHVQKNWEIQAGLHPPVYEMKLSQLSISLFEFQLIKRHEKRVRIWIFLSRRAEAPVLLPRLLQLAWEFKGG